MQKKVTELVKEAKVELKEALENLKTAQDKTATLTTDNEVLEGEIFGLLIDVEDRLLDVLRLL